MMDVLTDKSVHTAVYMTSGQVGKTEILNNMVGYFSDQDPSPILAIQPTVEMAEAYSKDRIAPMIRSCPCLSDIYGSPTSRASGNTLRHKQFPGGHLTISGANSPASLASRPVRIVLGDEIDRWPQSAGSEGDPVTLAEMRTENFHNRLHAYTSTPTVDGGRIHRLYKQGDQRKYFVPCPSCSGHQELLWENLEFHRNDDGHVVKAWFKCVHCSGAIEQSKLDWMLQHGEWRATAPFNGIASFYIWRAYSPWGTWVSIVEKFLESKDDRESLMAWTNTRLGLPFTDYTTSVEAPKPNKRCEVYGAEVPNDALVLTCGVDVQDNRLEAKVKAYRHREESWLVDYFVIGGDPNGQRPWDELDKILFERTWKRADGRKMGISATMIDSAGHRTTAVYKYVIPRQVRRVWASVGRDGWGRSIVSAPTKKKIADTNKVLFLFTIGVDEAKSIVYHRLNIEEPGPGFMHFPAGHEMVNQNYFDGLTSEKLVPDFKGRVQKLKWVKTRTRNEQLDTEVLALAALRALRPDYDKLKAKYEGKSETPRQEPAGDLVMTGGSFATNWKRGF